LERGLGVRDSAGFSLLELVIVVLLICLTLAITYPVLSRGSASLQLRASGRDFLNLLRYAREKAIMEQKGMMVTVDRSTRQVVMSDEFGTGSHSLVLPKTIRIQRYYLVGEEVVEGALVVHFLPNGSSENAEIVLQAETGALLKVITDPITGGARIQIGSAENSP
jgi:prepilin-type N-terminal cleavage/methylation domain-containing protein